MWINATTFFVILGILSIVVTEILRSAVDRKRRERDGFGGTGDIAIYGMIFGWACAIGAIVCGVGWLLQRFS
jgi:hypothetical protein